MIIVDDGSTDEGLSKIHTFKDSRLRIIQQKNAGVSNARNNGVKASTYKYLAFLDADDWWDPHFLEQMKFLIEIVNF